MSPCHLPSKALLLWRLRLLLCCCPAALVGGFLFFTLPRTFTVFTFVWFSLFLLLAFLYCPACYAQFTFAVTDAMVKINHGVFYCRMDAMYIQNIQYTAITQTPLQKLLGLASLHIHAAGGSLHIPAMDDTQARQLRITLLKRMEIHTHGN